MKPYAVSICCHNVGGYSTHVAYLINGASAKDVYERVSLHIRDYISPTYCMQASFITINVSDSCGDNYSENFPVSLEKHLMYCVN